MATLSRKELSELIDGTHELGISIYLPTHRAADTQQDPIRLKNLLREAEKQLIENGLTENDAKKLTEKPRLLLNNSDFWHHQSDSLAIFSSPRLYRYYQLPYSFKELVIVAPRFHIKPLLPLLVEDSMFYLLAASQKSVRFLQCTRDSVNVITPEEVPQGIDEALKYDQPEKQIQFHTGTSAGGGRRAAVFHGHGAGLDDTKGDILHYFQKIDRALHELLKEEQAPLVIAAVDYLHPIYREANTYPRLLPEGILGNPDEMSTEALQRNAWSLLQPYFIQDQLKAIQNYRESAGVKLTTSDLKEIARAAFEGRISVIFVALGVQEWGTFDQETRKVRIYKTANSNTIDLLDFAAFHTLMKGGSVYCLEPDKIPDKAKAAAILRY